MDLSIDDVADRAPFLSIYLSISPVFDNKIYYFLQSSIFIFVNIGMELGNNF